MSKKWSEKESYIGKNYLTLAEATKLCPGRPHVSAVWRWSRKGLKARSGENIRLRHIRVGGRIYTTGKWLFEFFTAVADSDSKYFGCQQIHTRRRITKKSHLNQREREIRLAESELETDGI